MKKNNIIKLYVTDKELKRIRGKRKKDNETEEDTEIENKDERPKNILQKIMDNDTKIETYNSTTKTFNIENIDILVLKIGNDYWYKAKDIATLFEFTNKKKAITRNVSNEYKKSYVELKGGSRLPRLKIDPQTLFIDDTGLFEMVAKSKKKSCINIWRKITKEILPELFTKGTYTLPATKNDIERLNKSFYTENMLSDYWNNPVVYLIYIGEYEGKHKIKYGHSTNFVRRDLDEHRKDFKICNVLGIWKTLAYELVEKKIEANFTSRNMISPLTIKNGKKETTKKEIIVINEINNIDYCIEMIENVVGTTFLPQEEEYKEIIKNLESEKEIMELKYKNKILENENKYLTELNNELKDKNNILKDTIKYLKK